MISELYAINIIKNLDETFSKSLENWSPFIANNTPPPFIDFCQAFEDSFKLGLLSSSKFVKLASERSNISFLNHLPCIFDTCSLFQDGL